MGKAKKPKGPKPAKPAAARKTAEPYVHPDQQSAMRPDIGTQANFRKKKAPATYRYDSSLSPTMEWDGQNGTRELGEWLLARVEEAAALPAPMRLPSQKSSRGATAVSA